MPIAVHNCKNAFQDATYGVAHRVVNPINKSRQGKGDPNRYRCTVCGGEVEKSSLVKGK